MNVGRFMLAGAAAMVLIAAPLGGQPPGQAAPGQPGERPDRAALERRVRERFAAVVQQRLQLDDAQARRLRDVNASFEQERRALFEQEREIRRTMREEMMKGDKADQSRVGELLDRMLRVQRQRLDVVEREQKQLAEFLTPVQRARYLALQDQLRRRVGRMGGPRMGRPDRPGPERGPRRERPPGNGPDEPRARRLR